ncbi:MAG: PIG-L family deacetylase, partial [Bdellovibrionales bacterium]|nr:PIG-L family deacetylase [Bdellovibrionales bacterium]
MMKKQKLLVVEAHSDDSCISVGGFLEKFRGQYDYFFALIASSDLRLHHHKEILKRERRLEEYQRYVDHFSGRWIREGELPFDADARLDQIPKREVVSAIEKSIATVQPEVLICQGPSFHHDHTIVYEAVIAATRPTAQYCPKEIYVMENPTYVHSLGPSTDFKPDFYVSLTDDQLERKLKVYRECFPSQIRED